MGSQLISPEALSGYVVGEGCFYVESGRDDKYRLGWRIRPAFCVEVRHDDREILESMKSLLGCGNIYELDFGRYRGYENKGWRPHVKYRVSNIRDIREKIIPFFVKHPLFGRKRVSFDIFCKVVSLMEKQRHLDADGVEEVKGLVKELNTLNKKGA